MNEQNKYKENYEKLKKNSIGSEKKCKDVRKKIIINSSIAAIVLTFALTCFVGTNKTINKIRNDININNDINNHDKISSISNVEYISGYRVYDIKIYSKLRVNDLLLQYNYTNYQTENNRRIYNYTAIDYSKIEELDESYLYGFYIHTDSKTLDEVCISLGYQSLQDYLTKNNYVDESGKIDFIKWENESLKYMANYMNEQTKKGNTK